MKKKLLMVIGILFIGVILYLAYNYIYPASPLQTVTYESGDVTYEVKYSRPFKNGRIIFGSEDDGALVPFGKYWRTGANAATTFSTTKDILIEGNLLKAGKYRLYTVPGEEKWEVFVNSEADTFFAIKEPDSAKDLMSFTVPTQQLKETVEQFTIDFITSPPDGSSPEGLRLRWDLTQIEIQFN